MADEKAQASEAAAAPAPSGGNPKMLLGILGLNIAVMVGVIAVVVLAQRKKEEKLSTEQIAQGAAASASHGAPAAAGGEQGAAAGKDAAPVQPEVRFFSVGDFTSNLAGPASTHYVKLSINFELGKEVDEEEMKRRKPQLRDRIISILNAKKPADLQTPEGQEFLKEEIKTVMNSIVKTGKIEGVYFSTFIVN